MHILCLYTCIYVCSWLTWNCKPFWYCQILGKSMDNSNINSWKDKHPARYSHNILQEMTELQIGWSPEPGMLLRSFLIYNTTHRSQLQQTAYQQKRRILSFVLYESHSHGAVTGMGRTQSEIKEGRSGQGLYLGREMHWRRGAHMCTHGTVQEQSIKHS